MKIALFILVAGFAAVSSFSFSKLPASGNSDQNGFNRQNVLLGSVTTSLLNGILGNFISLPKVEKADECTGSPIKKNQFECPVGVAPGVGTVAQIGSSCYFVPEWFDGESGLVEEVPQNANGAEELCGQFGEAMGVPAHLITLNSHEESKAVLGFLNETLCVDVDGARACTVGWGGQYEALAQGGLQYSFPCAGPTLIDFSSDSEALPCNVIYTGNDDGFQNALTSQAELQGDNCQDASLIPICEIELNGNPGVWNHFFLQH